MYKDHSESNGLKVKTYLFRFFIKLIKQIPEFLKLVFDDIDFEQLIRVNLLSKDFQALKETLFEFLQIVSQY